METQKKVLFLEDERSLAKIFSFHISHAGYEVSLAEDGEKGWDLLNQNDFDVVLLDLIMPKMDGFAFLEKLREFNKDIPVIVLSNLGQDSDLSKINALGVSKYFIKAEDAISDVIEYMDSIL